MWIFFVLDLLALSKLYQLHALVVFPLSLFFWFCLSSSSSFVSLCRQSSFSFFFFCHSFSCYTIKAHKHFVQLLRNFFAFVFTKTQFNISSLIPLSTSNFCMHWDTSEDSVAKSSKIFPARWTSVFSNIALANTSCHCANFLMKISQLQEILNCLSSTPTSDSNLCPSAVTKSSKMSLLTVKVNLATSH